MVGRKIRKTQSWNLGVVRDGSAGGQGRCPLSVWDVEGGAGVGHRDKERPKWRAS